MCGGGEGGELSLPIKGAAMHLHIDKYTQVFIIGLC